MRLLIPYLISIYILCFAAVATAQDKNMEIDSVLFKLDRNDYDKARAILQKTNVSKLTASQKVLYYLGNGKLAIYDNKFLEAYSQILKAKKYTLGKKTVNAFIANELIINLAAEITERNINVAELMAENCEIASFLKSPKLQYNCLFEYFAVQLYAETIESDREALRLGYQLKKIATKNKLVDELEGLEANLGTIHYFMKNRDSMTYYYTRALERRRIAADTASIILHLNNYARVQESIADYEGALASYDEAESLLKTTPIPDIHAQVLKGKAGIYELLGNDKQAVAYLKRFSSLKDSINTNALAVDIAELQSKYNTTEKERQNAILTAQNSDNQKQIYLLLLLLTAATATGFIFTIHKNRKEKLLIAQNEARQLKSLKLLKEQELSSINAMIEGQERERKRISRELHDDLGSNLTSVRVCIENVKNHVEDTQAHSLLDSAHEILSETYQKVRNISHINGSNKLAEGNLIEATQKLVDRISEVGNVDVEFVCHNMDKPLGNSLEIHLFRTIQELLSNMLKHANATEATVSLTGYEDYIDITVEDNGNGFSRDMQTSGLGLSAIASKTEAFSGTFTVDSSPGNGTTINIEIPYT